MKRRLVLQGLLAAMPAAAGFSALLAAPKQAMALGGTLPDLDQPAPDFALAGFLPPGTEGELRLSDFQGRWLALYFYPKDFTGGCTLEARGFQKDLAQFHQLGAEVVGVSADSAESHASFCGSEGLAFPLLSDPGGAVSRSYGSWISPYSQRHSFLIDPAGVLRETWVAVRPSVHSQDILASLQARIAATPSPTPPSSSPLR
jgi:peroxiredoxin Q/BCP